MISKQFNNINSSSKKNGNKKNRISIINCYLKWEDHASEKSYLEKMHNEIIKTPVKETLKSLDNKFGYLGYLREEVYDDRPCVMKYLFSEAWSEDNNDTSNNKNIKDGYCKVSSDYLEPDCQRLLEL